MEKEFRKEQHYAVSKGGMLAHIKEAHDNSEEYYCPHCGCRMLKRCGNIRAWHFAHDWRYADDYQKNCSYETYLHGYAKLRMKQWFDESESIILHYKQSIVCKLQGSCKLWNDNKCRKDFEKSCNLKQQFNRCIIEAPIKESNGFYRADLLLVSENNPNRRILIEIKVSHGCTEKKKASNAQIIEFDVSSEEDVEYIITHDVEESEKVRYYGFKNTIKQDESGIIKPAFPLQKFILFKSGKTFCKPCNCQTITNRRPSSLFEITTFKSEDNIWLLNLYGLMKAREHGIPVKNCFLCVHYCYSEENECYECKIKKCKIEKGADAINCQSYIYDSTIEGKLVNQYKTFPILDIWKKGM